MSCDLKNYFHCLFPKCQPGSIYCINASPFPLQISSPLAPPCLPSLWLKVHRPFQKRLYGLNQSQDHQTVFGECFKYKPAEDVVVHWYSCAKNTLNLRIKTEPVPGQARILDRDSDYFWDSAAHRTAD